jgi:hypothetical protein
MGQRKVVEYLFFSAISAIGTIGVSYVQKISETMNTLTKNVVELNAKMDIHKGYTETRLEDHETRLRRIEIRSQK